MLAHNCLTDCATNYQEMIAYAPASSQSVI